MQCPRCNGPMFSHDAPLPDGRSVTVDRCAARPADCGVWYDGDELAAAHARLGDRAVRDSLLEARFTSPAPRGAPQPACPRCATGELHAVRFVGVTLELCAACRGLWIDRAEYAPLMGALALYEPREGNAARAVHYREAAAAPVMERNATIAGRCGLCAAPTPLAGMVLLGDGAACEPCAAKLDAEERRRAEAWNPARDFLLALRNWLSGG